MISSTDNPRVKEVLRLRRSRERRLLGLFVAEGPREVGRALAAGLAAKAVYHSPELLPDWEHGGEEVTARVLARMSYRAQPEGVLGVFATPAATLPETATFVLVAVGIEKPGNLGALARSADAAGADALVIAEGEADAWNPNAIRASTGAVFTLPIVEATFDDVCALPHRKVAAVVGAATCYTDADLTGAIALIVGSEDEGLDRRWRDAADLEVAIPMSPRAVDSLNASTAAAVLLFEALRQRG